MLWILLVTLQALLAAIYFQFVLCYVLVWSPFHLSGPDDNIGAYVVLHKTDSCSSIIPDIYRPHYEISRNAI